jgi:bifunctional non-homologous end joining protein LigD
MAAVTASNLPEGPDWSYELKLDGYRALLVKEAGRIQLRSRNNKDQTLIYPEIVSAADHVKHRQLTIDGEFVALNLPAGCRDLPFIMRTIAIQGGTFEERQRRKGKQERRSP